MTQLFPDKVRKKWNDKKLDKKKYSAQPSCSTSALTRPTKTPHHQIYASANYEQNLEDIEKNHKLTWDDLSVYVQNACVVDQSHPRGCSTVYALVPVHIHENIDWDRRRTLPDRILNQIEAKLGLKGCLTTSGPRWSLRPGLGRPLLLWCRV